MMKEVKINYVTQFGASNASLIQNYVDFPRIADGILELTFADGSKRVTE